jgi:hypothetical protein
MNEKNHLVLILVITAFATALFLLEQAKEANAVIVHTNLTGIDIDTDKPLVAQFNSAFQKNDNDHSC